MKRREFITLLGGAAASWPLVARAQQPRATRTIGVFSGMSNEGQGKIYVKQLQQRLEELGWIEGRNSHIEYRWAAGDARKFQTQAKMVASRPDVIVAITTPAVAALRQETRDIPLIFANMSDPVDGGYVQSMARPGGNITGFTSFEYSIGGKWVELRKAGVFGRILRGAKPADLPVLQPTKFELIVNLKTAKSLGLKIADSFMLLADEVIE